MIYANAIIDISSAFLEPWRICGKFKDGFTATVGANDENSCMTKLIELTEKHGELVWYSGYEDLDYRGGEYIR